MLAPKMAGTPERVTEFSNDIANKLAKTHSAELEMLAGLKKAAGDDTPLRYTSMLVKMAADARGCGCDGAAAD